MFPGTDEKLAVWEDRVSGARERMAFLSLAGEGTAYVHLLGEDSKQLATVEVSLRSLIGVRGQVVTARLPGHPDTTGFVVSPVEVWGR